jgi:hypothetical protein
VPIGWKKSKTVTHFAAMCGGHDMNVLDQMLKKYNLGAEEDKTQAMREVMQEMASH